MEDSVELSASPNLVMKKNSKQKESCTEALLLFIIYFLYRRIKK